jgi:hypothetical protein
MSARPSRPSSTQAPTGRLWTAGCMGLLVGLVVALCGSVSLVALTASGGSLLTLPADAPAEDIVITVQEAYLTQVMAEALPALPSGSAADVQLDLQPGNRLAFKGRLRSGLAGLALEGDVSGAVYLDVRDGRLVVSVGDLNVFGFSLPAIGATLANELLAGMNQTIDSQLGVGLGQNVRLIGLSTDDRQLILRGRWEP